MYILFSLASLFYIVEYAMRPLNNDVIDEQWGLILLSKLIKQREENDFINNLFVTFELSYITFVLTIFIISPILLNHFMQENNNIFNLLNAALIISMV